MLGLREGEKRSEGGGGMSTFMRLGEKYDERYGFDCNNYDPYDPFGDYDSGSNENEDYFIDDDIDEF